MCWGLEFEVTVCRGQPSTDNSLLRSLCEHYNGPISQMQVTQIDGSKGEVKEGGVREISFNILESTLAFL